LTIREQRSGSKESNGRSEFSYGSFVRSVSLPPGAKEDDITATYDKRIPTISVGVSEPRHAGKRVQVQTGT
jgi:HSP20 family protein